MVVMVQRVIVMVMAEKVAHAHQSCKGRWF